MADRTKKALTAGLSHSPRPTGPFTSAQDHVDAVSHIPSQYDRFHAARAAMRAERKTVAPIMETLADAFLGADHMDEKGNIYRRVAMSVYLSEKYSADQAATIKNIIDGQAANKDYREITVIQSTSIPKADPQGIWKIDMIISTSMDYNKAKTLHRAIAEETGQKTDGSLFADEEKLIDWVVRRQIASRLEQALAKQGYDDLVLDVEILKSTELRLSTENVEPTSKTGSSMNFVF